jgi:SAM-dependent methyltransferase
VSKNDQAWYDRFFRHEYLVFDEHPETALEVDFIKQALLLKPETPVLDLCCGYGRHTIPLSDSCRIVGLDRSDVMIGRARSDNPGTAAFLQGDMLALPFQPETFSAVLSLFSSFGYFNDENQNYRVLQGISETLIPGGRFLIETVNREFVVRHSAPQQVYRPENMTLIEERSFDPISSRSHVDVTVFQDGRETHLHHSIRIYAFTELEMLLESVGLQTVSVWGDYLGGDYTVDSKHTILLAERL